MAILKTNSKIFLQPMLLLQDLNFVVNSVNRMCSSLTNFEKYK